MSHLATRRPDANRTTTAPSGRYGDRLSRYQGVLEAACDHCNAEGLDKYLNIGATEGAAVCRSCGHVHDNQRTIALEQEAI